MRLWDLRYVHARAFAAGLSRAPSLSLGMHYAKMAHARAEKKVQRHLVRYRVYSEGPPRGKARDSIRANDPTTNEWA